MELQIASEWGITLTIPPFKKVNYKSQRKGHLYFKAYKLLNAYEQKLYLEKQLNSCIEHFFITKYKWVFEPHQDNRLHVHLHISGECDQIITEFVKYFYTLVGIKSPKNYLPLSDVKELNDVSQWVEYMNKQVPSTLEEQKLTTLNLDNGIIKIDNLAEYWNSLDTKPESDESPQDYYRFGKINKKYIIDL